MKKKWIWGLAVLILLVGSITVFALTQRNVLSASDEVKQPTTSCCGPATVSKTTPVSIGSCCGPTSQKVQRPVNSQQLARPEGPIARKIESRTTRGCGCGSR